MYNKTLLWILMSIVLIPCLSGCASKKDSSFENLIPIALEDMNDQMTLSLPNLYDGVYEPKIGEIVTLALESHVDENIYFPSNYGVSIYNYYDNQWVEVKNLLDGRYYPISNRQISPTNNDVVGRVLISFEPDISNQITPTDLRIVVIGTVTHPEQNSSETVGAYLDITLNP